MKRIEFTIQVSKFAYDTLSNYSKKYKVSKAEVGRACIKVAFRHRKELENILEGIDE